MTKFTPTHKLPTDTRPSTHQLWSLSKFESINYTVSAKVRKGQGVEGLDNTTTLPCCCLLQRKFPSLPAAIDFTADGNHLEYKWFRCKAFFFFASTSSSVFLNSIHLLNDIWPMVEESRRGNTFNSSSYPRLILITINEWLIVYETCKLQIWKVSCCSSRKQ